MWYVKLTEKSLCLSPQQYTALQQAQRVIFQEEMRVGAPSINLNATKIKDNSLPVSNNSLTVPAQDKWGRAKELKSFHSTGGKQKKFLILE